MWWDRRLKVMGRTVRTDNELRLTGLDDMGDGHEQLSVAEMIGHLRAIEEDMLDDPCLVDLAAQAADLRTELEERRELALQVAAEIEAENCRMPN